MRIFTRSTLLVKILYAAGFAGCKKINYPNGIVYLLKRDSLSRRDKLSLRRDISSVGRNISFRQDTLSLRDRVSFHHIYYKIIIIYINNIYNNNRILIII